MRTIASIFTVLKVSDFLCMAGMPEEFRIGISPIVAVFVWIGLTVWRDEAQ